MDIKYCREFRPFHYNEKFVWESEKNKPHIKLSGFKEIKLYIVNLIFGLAYYKFIKQR